MPKRKRKHYDDSIKIRWREVLKKDIEETVLSNGKLSKDCKVVCMPGEDGYEILQVYDALGFRRRMITAVDSDRIAVRKLRKFGVNVVESDVNHFLWGNREIYDIINLDFHTQFNEDISETLWKISAEDRTIADNGFFGLTVVGKREDKGTQMSLKESAIDKCRLFDKNELDSLNIRDARDAGIQKTLLAFFGSAEIPELLKTSKNPSSWKYSVEMLKELITWIANLRYFIDGMKSYKYHSENGTPIISNFLHLRTYDEKISKYDRFIQATSVIRIPETSQELKEYMERALKIINREALRFGMTHIQLYEMIKKDVEFFEVADNVYSLSKKLPDVVYLGSSAKKPMIGFTEYVTKLKQELKEKKGAFIVSDFQKRVRTETKNTMYSLEAFLSSYKRKDRNRSKLRLTAEIAYDLLENEWQSRDSLSPKYIWHYFAKTKRSDYILRGIRGRMTYEMNKAADVNQS